MRTILTASVLVLVGVALQAGAAEDKAAPKSAKEAAPYVHSVIFYLKKDAGAGATEAIISDAHKLLTKIPTVRKVWAGRPAAEATPKFAVTDYQVGLLVLFDNYQGLKTYLDHDMHTEFVNRHGKNIDRVVVYDFLNQKK